MHTRHRALVLLALCAIASPAVAQLAPSKILDSLEFRQIGPWRGGRSCAVTGVKGQPDTFYFGATGGGVWKSTNAGQDWENVSDGFFKTGSVGAIASSESHPDTIYVGMGETELRGNISHGDGVYRSDDGGKTWRHLGLAETQSIARIKIHPTNPDIAWVAALGHVYGPHTARGIYKTTDGGKTWRKTLYVNDRAGAQDISIDPSDPNTLYATTWEAFRTAYTLSSGGPGSKLFKSTDGGETWQDITKSKGLPTTVLGKISVAISPKNPKRIFCMLEAEQGGLYRSDDSGQTWELINQQPEYRQRPWYYTRVYADPNDAETVYVMNVQYGKSTDGGKTFRSGSARHSDHHDCWIDPNDSTRIIMANDGGASVSVDGGRNWSEQDTPTAQFYHVDTDNSFPYNILGAQQDNSTVRIPSRTFGAGITSEDWESTAGGESGYVTAHPTEPWIVFGGSYGGDLSWFNHQTRMSRSIDAWPDNPMGAGAADLTQRFQWTFPIVFSPHNPEVLYTCSQFVLRSDDRGQSWKKISPDLSYNDKSKQQSSGGPITKDNTSVEYYGTVFTLAESPVKRGLIWAGTDDGRVHVTDNGGGKWREVTPPQMPRYARIRMVEPSSKSANTAYLAVDNHESDDYAPYAYRTDDGGKTWSLITGGLPRDSYVRVVREDPVDPNILYAGLETGIFVSYSRGDQWQPLTGKNFPVVPVHNLRIKEDDLVVGTHGRSFWVLDDLSVVRQAAKAQASTTHVFAPKASHLVRFGRNGTSVDGQNPANSGPAITIWAPTDGGKIAMKLYDSEGTEVGTGDLTLKAGLNTLGVRAQYPSFEGFPGMLFWAAGRRPVSAPPGIYTAKLQLDGKDLPDVQVKFLPDPRSGATEAQLVEKWKLAIQIRDSVTAANKAVVRIRELKKQLSENNGDAKTIEALNEIEDALNQGKARSSQDLLNYPIRLNNKLAALLGVVDSGPFPATAQSFEVYKDLKSQLDSWLKKLAAIESKL